MDIYLYLMFLLIIVFIILVSIAIYRHRKYKGYKYIAAGLYITIAFFLAVLGFALLNWEKSTNIEYDVGLVLVDNFIGAIIFGGIIFVVDKLIKEDEN